MSIHLCHLRTVITSRWWQQTNTTTTHNRRDGMFLKCTFSWNNWLVNNKYQPINSSECVMRFSMMIVPSGGLSAGDSIADSTLSVQSISFWENQLVSSIINTFTFNQMTNKFYLHSRNVTKMSTTKNMSIRMDERFVQIMHDNQDFVQNYLVFTTVQNSHNIHCFCT